MFFFNKAINVTLILNFPLFAVWLARGPFSSLSVFILQMVLVLCDCPSIRASECCLGLILSEQSYLQGPHTEEFSGRGGIGGVQDWQVDHLESHTT